MATPAGERLRALPQKKKDLILPTVVYVKKAYPGLKGEDMMLKVAEILEQRK